MVIKWGVASSLVTSQITQPLVAASTVTAAHLKTEFRQCFASLFQDGAPHHQEGEPVTSSKKLVITIINISVSSIKHVLFKIHKGVSNYEK